MPPILGGAGAGSAVVEGEEGALRLDASLEDRVDARKLSRRRREGLRLLHNGAQKEVLGEDGKLVELRVSGWWVRSRSSK
jgi:hypothetical protein